MMAFLLHAGGVTGPFEYEDLLALVEQGLVEETSPGVFEATESGRAFIAEMRNQSEP
jgi:hypothetical protein